MPFCMRCYFSIVPLTILTIASAADVSETPLFFHAFSDALGPVLQNPVFDNLTIFAHNLNINGSFTHDIVKVFWCFRTTHSLIDCLWSMTGGNLNWFVSELCAKLLKECSQLYCRVALVLHSESSYFFLITKLSIREVRCDFVGKRGLRSERCLHLKDWFNSININNT